MRTAVGCSLSGSGSAGPSCTIRSMSWNLERFRFWLALTNTGLCEACGRAVRIGSSGSSWSSDSGMKPKPSCLNRSIRCLIWRHKGVMRGPKTRPRHGGSWAMRWFSGVGRTGPKRRSRHTPTP